jgi:hypothetical protein
MNFETVKDFMKEVGWGFLARLPLPFVEVGRTQIALS